MALSDPRNRPYSPIMRLIPFLLLILPTMALAAAQSPGTARFEHGFFCALEPIAVEEANDTVSGTVTIVADEPIFLAPGPQVPAQLGIGFGVIVQPLPQYAGPVTISVQHPPMGPNGVTRQSWQAELFSDDTTYLGFTFEDRYEVVRGEWTLSAQSNGRPIYSVRFQVTDPARLRPVTCGEQVPLS